MKNLSLFIESDINIISYYPSKGKLYKIKGMVIGIYREEGEEEIQSYSPYNKEIFFVNNPQPYYDSLRPKEKLRQNFPFNNWGFNAGIRFYPDFKTYASAIKKIFVKQNKTEKL